MEQTRPAKAAGEKRNYQTYPEKYKDVSERVKLVRQMISEKINYLQAQKQFGIDEGTVRRWCRRYGDLESFDYIKKPVRCTYEVKMTLVRRVAANLMTVEEACSEHKISVRTFEKWLSEFLSKGAEKYVTGKNMIPQQTASSIKDLEKALAVANLKILGLETMIDIAEKQLKTNIRKKSGAKQ